MSRQARRRLNASLAKKGRTTAMQLVLGLRTVVVAVSALSILGCSTTIRSYPIREGVERKGGVPFFIPKPVAQVREPIEVSRIESLYAIIDLGGMDEFLFELQPGSLDESVERLKKILKSGDVSVEERQAVPFYLQEESSSEKDVRGANQSRDNTSTKKYGLVTGGTTKSDAKTLYRPSDIEKAFTVIWIPDSAREYELVLTPSSFASSDLSVKLTDGWRLDTISAKTGDNQAVKELADTLRTVIGAQKEIKVAEIAKEQALKLKELALAQEEPAPAPGFKGPEGVAPKRVIVTAKITGYAKKTVIRILKPGLYELRFEKGALVLPQEETIMWERMEL